MCKQLQGGEKCPQGEPRTLHWPQVSSSLRRGYALLAADGNGGRIGRVLRFAPVQALSPFSPTYKRATMDCQKNRTSNQLVYLTSQPTRIFTQDAIFRPCRTPRRFLHHWYHCGTLQTVRIMNQFLQHSILTFLLHRDV